nr:uncharacterized protein DKFZp434B061-like [Aegilops tauschii subsp. strangulata]
MAGPPRPAPAAPPVRRSARLRPQATHQPPCSPPPPSPPAAAGSPGGTDPRRSVRISVRTRVRGLPSAAPSSSRIRRKSPAAPLRRTVQACAEEWGAAKAASGAPAEECVLPFLQKGAPRKVRATARPAIQLPTCVKQDFDDNENVRFARNGMN